MALSLVGSVGFTVVMVITVEFVGLVVVLFP